MKRYLFLFGCLCSTMTILSSCRHNVLRGKGPEATKNPTLSYFNAVEVDVPMEITVNVQPGAQPALQITGYENLLDEIRMEVRDSTLHITRPSGWDFASDRDMKGTITVPSLVDLALAGSADAEIHGNITGAAFDLDIAGNDRVIIDNINVPHFTTSISGLGHLTVKGGTVALAEYDMSGAGNIKAFDLQTNDTKASISGACSADVTAQHTLNADISGAGHVHYKGHPQVSSSVSGLGGVTDVN
jgi:hypothetical protein